MKRFLKSERGQSMVEFALVLPILLLLLCGIIDFGWVFAQKIEINNSCREAARYTAIHYNDSDVDNDAAIAQAVFEDASPLLSSPTVTISLVDDRMTVNVTAEAPILTGFTSLVIGRNTINLSTSCTMRLEV